MFCYTFSIINTLFVPWTGLLYEQNSNNKIVHNSIEHFLCNPSDFFSDDVLSYQWIVFTKSVFQVPSQKKERVPERKKTHGHPIPKISTHLTIFWGGTCCGNNPQSRQDIIRKEIRRIAQEMLYRAVDSFIVPAAAVLSYSRAVHGTNIILIIEKV